MSGEGGQQVRGGRGGCWGDVGRRQGGGQGRWRRARESVARLSLGPSDAGSVRSRFEHLEHRKLLRFFQHEKVLLDLCPLTML